MIWLAVLFSLPIVSLSLSLETQAALKYLKVLSVQPDSVDLSIPEQQQQLRSHLIHVASLADHHNFGVCADEGTQGFTALAHYLSALGYPVPFNLVQLPAIDEPVYIKFNGQTLAHYHDSYTGDYRGVLISCLSSDYDQLNGTFGHFPLNLFDNQPIPPKS
ncbi:DUF1824 family protein [Roseofilum sp. BLCC_M91]|uniref:DUF1824 family protein n=1 Tax=Roseofilum halophilum BLCC-M91 TaxID=3022259 RepID=A0ABT7BLZ9_9CYAN|nr:DUF1824 family protein [Roseofilum halophilum]MDJ1180227.1 DUF1824 family protein [Roseofilum halophilum BLCC-M91]